MAGGLRHHLVTRGALPAAAVVATIMAVVAATAPAWWVPASTLGPLLASMVVARGLTGDDVLLERSTPRQRPWWRLAHVLAGTVLCGMPVTVTAARNGIGLFGMALLSVTVVRAAAWAPSCVYLLFVLLAAPHEPVIGASWWAWPVQPGDAPAPWLIAVVLLATGAAAYVRRGPAE